MDHQGSDRVLVHRTGIIGHWLTALTVFSMLGVFISPLGDFVQQAAAAPIGAVTVTLSPDTQSHNVGDMATVSATVKRTNTSLPVAFASVDFTVTGPNAATATRVSDVHGNVSFSYSGDTAGEDTVVATFNGTDSNEVTVDWNALGPTLDLAPSTQTVNIGGTASIAVTLTRPSGTINNIPVRYAVTGANPGSATVNTDSTGKATISYSGDTVGTDTITAYADFNRNGSKDSGEPSDTATITWTGYTISLAPATQTSVVGNQVEIDATVLNGADGISNVSVRYSVTGVNSSGGSVVTDSNGDATFHYTGTVTGTDTVTAYADLNQNNTQDNGEPSDSVTVTWSGAGLSLSPTTQTATIGATASITATLTNPSISVLGVIIRYTVTGANSASGSVATNASGAATVSYTGSHAGTDTISVYADFNNNSVQDGGEPTASATVTRIGNISLSLSPTQANPNTGTTAYVSVTASGNPIGNIIVRYSVAGANPTSGMVVTDGSGHTVISYTGNQPGTDTVSAFADLDNNGVENAGEPTASTTIVWKSPGTQPPPNIFQPALPASAKSGCTYFPATQHNLCGGFQAYWNAFGSLATFGMPLTEEFQENGVTVQYFERERFEWHPGAYPSHFDVLLGLLGSEVTQGRSAEAPFKPTMAKTTSGCTYFAETGHNLCAGFAAFWNQYGGLAVYGYPISEEFQEKNPDTGEVYTVQYFQRARFEWHPGEAPSRFDVELGRLGAQVLQMKYGVSYS